MQAAEGMGRSLPSAACINNKLKKTNKQKREPPINTAAPTNQ